MALRNIVCEGDPALKKKCRVVTDYNAHLHELLDDLRDTLIAADGVGLAAPQVGVLRRVCVVLDTTREDVPPEERIIELINPEIIAEEGEQTGLEGCLSIPGVYGIVTRPDKVTVKAYDRFGKEFEITGETLTARAFCHEIDHLDGHLYREFADKMLSPEELEELLNTDDNE